MSLAALGPSLKALPDAVPPRWQVAMRTAVRDAAELCRRLNLPPEYEAAAERAGRRFPVFAPLSYIARMRPGDPHDPLLRQVLPMAEEEADVPGFVADPLSEATAERAPGLLHKYRGRALLVTTGACAIHCRYCFRRNYPYDELPRGMDEWAPALETIAADSSIEEIILSGGDPLTLSDARLSILADRLAAIGHLRRLRIHTRLPVVIPERVCDELLAWLAGGVVGRVDNSSYVGQGARPSYTQRRPWTSIVVVHANHPAELDDAVAAALARLAGAGVLLLNQAVLLRGVNDDAGVLARLSQRLIECRVAPYYLHQLDRVAGAAHFEVPESRGRQLIEELRRRLPSYAVPRYVRETPGQPHKELLA